MKRLLAAAVLVACMPVANAQDKGKSDFTHNAEFRLRDLYQQNESGNEKVKPSHHNGIDQRFKLGLGFKANEKFSLGVTLLQSTSWGQQSTDTQIGDHSTISNTGTGTQENFMSVNEAYANWMMSEDFWMRFGRSNFSFGDGSVMSTNDWEAQPYSFDGVTAHYEFEFGRLTALAFKYRDLSKPTAVTLSNNSDPQHDAYGLVFDMKSPMPEWLKMVNVYVIQDVQDGSDSNAGSTVNGLQNQNALRYGVLGGFNFSMIDLKVGYNMVSGKNTDYTTGVANATDRTISENMMQAEVGVNLPNLMSSRIALGYHQDSGTKAADKTTKDNTYDAYFYEKHGSTGLMDIFGWGNFTDINVSWTVKPSDSTTAGLAYHMLSKTQKEDAAYMGTYGLSGTTASVGNAPATLDCAGTAGDECKSALGSEIDLWAEHKYDGGLAVIGRVSYFTPGEQLKTTTNDLKDSITQVFVQGKLTF